MQRFLVAGATLCAIVLGACRGKSGDGAAQAGAPGSVMPRLTGKTLDGEYVALDDFRGRVVLLNVWATWCEPCRDELPELQRLHARRADEGLAVLGWSVDKPQAIPRARSLLHQAGVAYPVVLDPDGGALDELAIRGYPTTFVVGRDGTLRWRRDGIVRPDDEELASILRTALDESPG